MKRLCVCVVLSAMLVVASQVRATPERGLTKAESWSAYGGESSKCYSGMGRCYTDPSNSDCAAYSQEDCDQTSIVVTIHDLTCESSDLSYSNCTEKGDQVKCVKTTTCHWVDPNGASPDPGHCESNNSWTYVGTTKAGQLGVEGDDCNNPPTPPAEEYNY